MAAINNLNESNVTGDGEAVIQLYNQFIELDEKPVVEPNPLAAIGMESELPASRTWLMQTDCNTDQWCTIPSWLNAAIERELSRHSGTLTKARAKVAQAETPKDRAKAEKELAKITGAPPRTLLFDPKLATEIVGRARTKRLEGRDHTKPTARFLVLKAVPPGDLGVCL